MNRDHPSLTEVTPQEPGARPNLLYRRVVLPVLALLRMCDSPERLAWSIAAGAAIGICPLLGTTTALCLAVAMAFRLNLAASQFGNYLVYPLQLLLVIPFLRAGRALFRTAPIPLAPDAILQAARSHPIALVKQLWLWEWHALVVWAATAAIAMPLVALGLIPALRRLMDRHHEPRQETAFD